MIRNPLHHVTAWWSAHRPAPVHTWHPTLLLGTGHGSTPTRLHPPTPTRTIIRRHPASHWHGSTTLGVMRLWVGVGWTSPSIGMSLGVMRAWREPTQGGPLWSKTLEGLVLGGRALEWGTGSFWGASPKIVLKNPKTLNISIKCAILSRPFQNVSSIQVKCELFTEYQISYW